MQIIQITDGMVLDHVAEFCYYPSQRLKGLFAQDGPTYIDSLCKLIQLIVFSDSLVMSKDPPNAEMKKLKEELEIIIVDNDPKFKIKESVSTKINALVELKSQWHNIDNALSTDKNLFSLVEGHLKREFARCFLLPPLKRETMLNFVNANDTLILAKSNIRGFSTAIKALPAYSKAKLDQQLEGWINRNLTTHYRNYYAMLLTYDISYTPAGTRSLLPVYNISFSEGAKQRVIRCIAVDVLKSANRYKDGRKHILEEALKWRNSQTADRAREGLRTLAEKSSMLDEVENARLLDSVNDILESDLNYQLGMLFGASDAIMKILTFQEPKENMAMKTPRSMLWLYRLRHKKAIDTMLSITKELICK